MKAKVFVMAAMLFAGVNAFAQEAECCAEGCCEGAATSYVTNQFGDNWFLGGGLGASFILDGPWSDPNIGTGLVLDLNFGKWIDPSWGIRAGVKGLGANHRQKGLNDPFNFALIHGDIMWNVQNQFSGYKADRKFQVIPYLTAGLYAPFDRSKNFTAGAGLLGKVALTEKLDLDIDLTGIFLKQACVAPVNTCGGLAAKGIATVGVSYKFGKSTWQTKAEAIAPYVAAAAAAKAASDAKDAEVAAAKEEAAKAVAAAQENAGKTDEVANAILDSYFQQVTFEGDKWSLSNREKVALQSAAALINAVPCCKFVVTGYADKQTGYAAYNQKLSEKRADAVKKYLVECGVCADQLVVEAKGGVDKMYLNDYKLSRCAVIKAQK